VRVLARTLAVVAVRVLARTLAVVVVRVLARTLAGRDVGWLRAPSVSVGPVRKSG
jgi:hypothetical protein